MKAQKELKNGQQTLNDAQRKLADTQKQAAAKVDEQAKQDVDAMRMKLAEARAKLMGKAGGQAGGQGNILLGQIQPGNVSNEGKPLAQMDVSSIIKENTQDPGLDTAAQQKTAEANQVLPLLDKETLLRLKSVGKNDLSNSDQLKAAIPGGNVPFGSQKNRAEALLGKGTTPIRELASAGAVTDVGYSNGSIRILTDEHGNIYYGDDGDPEMTITDPYPNVTPNFTPKPTPSSTTEPTPTPSTSPTSKIQSLGWKEVRTIYEELIKKKKKREEKYWTVTDMETGLSLKINRPAVKNNGYHIDWYAVEQKEVISFARELLGVTSDEHEDWVTAGGWKGRPAILTLDDGTQTTGALILFPHGGSPGMLDLEHGHFEFYLKDSKQSDPNPSQIVLAYQAIAKDAYELYLQGIYKNTPTK